jgi:serine/threonine protein phosphatase 1
VIDRLIQLRDSRTAHFLLGNHDEVFLKAASGDLKALRFLTKIGGKETILSYGLSIEEYEVADYSELARLVTEKVPPAHTEFLSSFHDYLQIGDYLFVHAGIRPGVSLDEQSTTDLRWIRGEFLNCRDHHGTMVIHGHSISEEPDVRGNRVGIDTGAFASGRLTAIGLEEADRWFLSTSGAVDSRWERLSD